MEGSNPNSLVENPAFPKAKAVFVFPGGENDFDNLLLK